MNIPDLLMFAAFLITPPILLAAVRNRFRAVIYSVVTLWLLMIVGGQYHLAYTPGSDSFAPGLALVIGWLPSVIYTLIWLGIFALAGSVRPTKPDG